MALSDLAVRQAKATGKAYTACHSEGDTVSGVLAAMGIDTARAAGAIRLSTGWATTLQDIERAADALIGVNADRGRWIGETEYRFLTELLTPQCGDHVLDVGCGTGWFTRRIAGLAGVEVTGADIDSEALTFAREHDTRSRYMEADACCLPFANDSFRKVMSVTALCFTADWPQALSEIVRVTSDRFAVGVLNRHSLLWWKKGRIDPFGVSMADVGGVPAAGGTLLRWNSESMANPG